MNTLSVIIITKNEAINIVDCINSVSFANEILVLDSGSTDKTVELALSAGAKVFKTDWLGFGHQKNRGIELSENEWIFVLDSDERVSYDLAEEIQNAIKANKYAVFEIPRRSMFISKFIGHCGWSPDYTKRLFKKGAAKFSSHTVHEHLETSLRSGRLRSPLIHYSYRDFETVLQKMNHYSSAGAIDALKAGKKGGLGKAIAHGIWAFIRTYFIKTGFLDGKEGLMISIANAEVTYYKYLKLNHIDS